MKKFFAALIFAAMPLGGAFAAPYAPQEFDFSGLDGVAYGTVELVQPAPATPTELPEKADAALVRLDDGRSITVVLRPLQHVEPGERVRVLVGAKRAGIERTWASRVSFVTRFRSGETERPCSSIKLCS